SSARARSPRLSLAPDAHANARRSVGAAARRSSASSRREVISMVIAEPVWLQTLGQMAGTLLLIELVLVLLVVSALMIAIAYAAWWLRRNVVPVVDQYGGETQRLLAVAERGSDRVARGVAEFHGRWEGLQTTVQSFVFGRRAAQREPTTPAVTLIPSDEAR